MTSVCPAGHTSTADDYCDVCGVPIPAGAQPSASELPGSAPAAPPAPSAPNAPTAGGQPCPNCGTANSADALFCENCGYDFTTGSLPRTEGAPAAGTAEGSAEATTVAPAADQTSAGPVAENADGDGAAAGSAAMAGDRRSVAPDLPFRWVAEVWIDPAWYQAQDSPDPLPSPGLPEVIPLRHASILVGRRSRSRNIHPEVDCGADSGVSRRQAQLTSDGTRWFVEDLDSANGTFVAPASGVVPTDPIPVGSKRELDPDDRVYVGAWTRLVIREATEDELATLA